MSYMTMEGQIASHLTFLKNQNLAVEKLDIDGGFIRCCAIDLTTGRGELCYRTQKNLLKNGMVGLATWCRSGGGQTNTHRTYGMPVPEHHPKRDDLGVTVAVDTLEELRRADVFWRMSDQIGEAEYLQRKGVGYYGIRFRQTDYGKIAVVPMRDINGKFSSYQLINADGTKRFCRNIEIKGLLHVLHTPVEKFAIGIAESYITAATCYELTGMAMVTAFSCNNLKRVAVGIRKRFPENPIIIFGDNDRHLPENKGVKAAYAVKKELGETCSVAIPDFGNYAVNRGFSDWNDFVRECGVKEARDAISKALNEV